MSFAGFIKEGLKCPEKRLLGVSLGECIILINILYSNFNAQSALQSLFWVSLIATLGERERPLLLFFYKWKTEVDKY